MNETALLRPGWTPLTTVLMVLGFVVYWPLGLVMLAYIIWGDRLARPGDGFGRSSRRAYRRCRNRMRGMADDFGASRMNDSGNSAFDEWRRGEMDRIEAERRKLDAMRAEFDDYMRELRKARDREEFERFMKTRAASGNDATTES